MQPPVIKVDHVSKQYPNGFLALEQVSLSLYAGELHALLGENGAGKSTLMNILYGVHAPTAGGLLLNGRQVVHRKPSDAIANGIGMVHQHFKLIAPFTVAENLALVAQGARRAAFRRPQAVRDFMQSFGIDLDPQAVVQNLPLALQQQVEILKALVHETRVLLLDEPSTILTPTEIDALYATLARIQATGTAVAVVTHHVDEVMAHADRYTILRRGRTNGTGLIAETTAEALVEKIVGHAVDSGSRFALERAGGAERWRVTGGFVPPSAGSPGLQDVNLVLHEGEVVGVAGVEGNGQTELFELLAGQCQLVRGEVVQADASATVALVPQDRHHEGLSLDLPVAHNLLYTRIMQGDYRRGFWLDHAAIAAEACRQISQSDIRTQSPATPTRALSGGNQQKIVLARAIAQNAPILVAYQPTRGLDVAAADAVLGRLAQAAQAGTTVVVISSNIDELVRVADRIVVMNAGRIAGEVRGARMTLEHIGPLMTMNTSPNPSAAEEAVCQA